MKVTQRCAGLTSANRRLRVALLGSRAEVERLRLQREGKRFEPLDPLQHEAPAA
jgi:hypothetical protein